MGEKMKKLIYVLVIACVAPAFVFGQSLQADKELPKYKKVSGISGNLSSIGKNGVVIGVSLLGLEASRQEQIIAMIARQQLRVRQLLPLFLTDDDDFRSLRREHFVFEYLPPWPGERTGISKETWKRFLLDRLLLIRRKWGVRRFVSFHGRPDAGVAALVETDWEDSSSDDE